MLKHALKHKHEMIIEKVSIFIQIVNFADSYKIKTIDATNVALCGEKL